MLLTQRTLDCYYKAASIAEMNSGKEKLMDATFSSVLHSPFLSLSQVLNNISSSRKQEDN